MSDRAYGASGSSPPVRIAYHEAGHAVAASQDDRIGIQFVTIEEEGVYLGRTRIQVAPWMTNQIVMVDLAGPIAERMWTLRRAGRRYRSSSDSTLRWWLAEHDRPFSGFGEWLMFAQADVVETLEANWSQVERVAALLLERETLTGAEFRAVVADG